MLYGVNRLQCRNMQLIINSSGLKGGLRKVINGNNNGNSAGPKYDDSDCHPIESNNHNDTHEITKANNNKRRKLDNDDNNHIVFLGLCNKNKHFNRINVDKNKSIQVQMLLSLNESIFISSFLLLRFFLELGYLLAW